MKHSIISITCINIKLIEINILDGETMDFKKDNIKKNIFLALSILFAILTLVAVGFGLSTNFNIIFSALPVLGTVFFSRLYDKCKRNMDKDK